MVPGTWKRRRSQERASPAAVWLWAPRVWKDQFPHVRRASEPAGRGRPWPEWSDPSGRLVQQARGPRWVWDRRRPGKAGTLQFFECVVLLSATEGSLDLGLSPHILCQPFHPLCSFVSLKGIECFGARRKLLRCNASGLPRTTDWGLPNDRLRASDDRLRAPERQIEGSRTTD